VAAFCPPKGGRPRDSPLGAERPEVHTEVHLDAQTKGGGRICICLPGSSGSGALVQQHMQTWSSPEHHSPLKPAGFRVFCRWRGRRPLLFAELILANSTRFQLVWAFFVVVVGSWLGDPVANYKKDPGRSKRSPNGTDLRTPNRTPCTLHGKPHRGACTRHQPRWAGETSTPDSTAGTWSAKMRKKALQLTMTRRR
jgi:hypothetical protein